MDDFRINLAANQAVIVGVDDASLTEDDWHNRLDQFARDVGFSGKAISLIKVTATATAGYPPCGEYAAALLFEYGNNGEYARVFRCAESIVHRLANFGNEIACVCVILHPGKATPNYLDVTPEWARSPRLHRTSHRDRWVFRPCSEEGKDYIRWIIRATHPGESYRHSFKREFRSYGARGLPVQSARRVDLSLLWG